MFAFLNSKTTLLSLRAIPAMIAAFLAGYIWLNQHRPCEPIAAARYDLGREDLPLMASALTVAVLTPVWLLLHHRQVKCVVKFNYACEILCFVLVFVPTMYWGSSRTATLACARRSQLNSVCLRNTCTVVRATMITACVLMAVLALASMGVLRQWRAPLGMSSISKPTSFVDATDVTVIDIETPRETCHTEILTPTTVEGSSSIQSK
ncbi:hypothetical protein H257_04266 [Aphanomyces astaci]|uniref:Uncharacterized protein n=2 Tax=Aphanomyces astaci TaxID=112090 RepID=W4GXE8_APHAT|nr:hypothetical protein H257_04266 [Aphanomyces astaci]ETV83563.1 hypothetical protein H257_04266 [Aphanomyces astaci]|eukprot:XP_009826993.1 hypothetical protein H257_04266 [Aphanomyces astaci]